MSLPNILSGEEEEDAENLIKEQDRPDQKLGEKKEKRKWYNRLSPGQLLSPFRNSILKLKRKHDDYKSTENVEVPGDIANEVASEKSDNVSSDASANARWKDEHEQYNILSEKKISISDDSISYFIDEKIAASTPGFESVSKFIDVDANSKHATLSEHFGEARALVHRRVTVTDILSGRYRKL